jgi:hypothetical protein
MPNTEPTADAKKLADELVDGGPRVVRYADGARFITVELFRDILSALRRDTTPTYVHSEATVPLRLVNSLIESLEPAIHYEGVLLTLSLRDRQAVRKAIADVRATISHGG